MTDFDAMNTVEKAEWTAKQTITEKDLLHPMLGVGEREALTSPEYGILRMAWDIDKNEVTFAANRFFEFMGKAKIE